MRFGLGKTLGWGIGSAGVLALAGVGLIAVGPDDAAAGFCILVLVPVPIALAAAFFRHAVDAMLFGTAFSLLPWLLLWAIFGPGVLRQLVWFGPLMLASAFTGALLGVICRAVTQR